METELRDGEEDDEEGEIELARGGEDSNLGVLVGGGRDAVVNPPLTLVATVGKDMVAYMCKKGASLLSRLI